MRTAWRRLDDPSFGRLRDAGFHDSAGFDSLDSPPLASLRDARPGMTNKGEIESKIVDST
jgi:hypothetical protein